jgi:hypothetical protein
MSKYTKDTLPKDVEECDCSKCESESCPHRGAFRRLPRIIGGLGLCPNLAGRETQ